MRIAVYTLLVSIAACATAYGEAIILWQKQVRATDERGAHIITHEVPAGVVQYATVATTCAEGNAVEIHLDGVAEISPVASGQTKSSTIKLDSDGKKEEFVFALKCHEGADPCRAEVTISVLTLPQVAYGQERERPRYKDDE